MARHRVACLGVRGHDANEKRPHLDGGVGVVNITGM